MHPAPCVLPLAVVEDPSSQFHALIDEHRHQGAPRLCEPLALAADIRWTHDGDIDLVAVLSGGCVENLFRVSVEGIVWQGSDFVDGLDVGPDLGVQLAQVCWVGPIGDDACTGQM